MPSGPIVWIVILILIIAGVYFLANSVDEVPTETIEVDVEMPDAADTGENEG